MANTQCASTGNKIRLKKKRPDTAMANASATIRGHQGTGMGQYNIVSQGVMGTRHKIRLKKRVLTRPWCASTGNKIRLKKKSHDTAMANASATIIGHQGTGMGPI